MSDSEELYFESKADARASKAYPQQAGTIRKNGYLVIENRPSKVSLLTENGNSKDDLRLPTDDNLLSQVCSTNLCEGPCMRSFHAKIVDGEDSYCATLGYTKAEVKFQYFHPVDANAMDRCQQLDALMHYLSLGEQRTSLVQIDRPTSGYVG